MYFPRGATPAGGWPIASWAHGTRGLGDACAPSASPPGRLDPYLSAWLDAGYAVTATDYVGLGSPGGHPYLDGKSQAHGVIDIVRAARATTPELSRHWMTVGMSQGGHAAAHTAHLAPRYAPELDYRGAVAVGVPTNLAGFISLIGPTFPPTLVSQGTKVLIAYILAGLRTARPDFDLDSFLTPLGKEVVADAENLCLAEMNDRMATVDLATMFTKDLGDPFKQAWGSVFDVPVTGYTRPLLVAQGTQDQTVPQALTEQWVRDLRNNAQPVTYKTYPADHTGSLTASLSDSLTFADTLFEDIPPPTTTTPPHTSTTPPTSTTTPTTTTPPSTTPSSTTTPPTSTTTLTSTTTPPTTTTTPPTTTTAPPSTTTTHPTSTTSASTTTLPTTTTQPTTTPPADTTPPTAALNAVPFLLLGGKPITGTAADNHAVTAVTLTFTDLFTGRRTTREATCAPACATWSTATTGLRGLHSVTAQSRDAAGNTSAPTAKVTALIFG
ncbi:lipase family protein [Actinokineospora soli]|uniref:Lipase family protein n=1 Tax=Actinokineospora soli TaxID=1048753 RepID=A0ABW2TMQ8_9PSEU